MYPCTLTVLKHSSFMKMYPNVTFSSGHAKTLGHQQCQCPADIFYRLLCAQLEKRTALTRCWLLAHWGDTWPPGSTLTKWSPSAPSMPPDCLQHYFCEFVMSAIINSNIYNMSPRYYRHDRPHPHGITVRIVPIPTVFPSGSSPSPRYYREVCPHPHGFTAVTTVIPSLPSPCRSLVQEGRFSPFLELGRTKWRRRKG